MTTTASPQISLTVGDTTYEWIDDWAKIPQTDSASRGWAHPGVVVTAAGQIVTVHPGEPAILFFDADGRFLRSWQAPVTEAHGLALSREGDTEYLWVADPGSKRAELPDYSPKTAPGQVLKMTLDGRTAMSIARPDLPIYAEGKYSPTAIAVFEERLGGNGDVWVADGYGMSRVHRFDKYGRYIGSIDGEEGDAGAFRTPHGVAIDWRKSHPELLVADRTNHRVQIYDLDGRWKRVVGEDFMTSPSVFAFDGDRLIVGELRARLTLLDADDRLVGYLGENEAVCNEPGWPNQKDAAGNPARTERLQSGKLNSPHGLAADPQGNLYIAEWLIGGRFTKLAKRYG
jgi:DNA-binding beta-propeller fold protein YncE